MEKRYALYNEASKYGQEASFIANVILTRMTRPTKKLQGLVNLLHSGIEVRTAQFDISTLVINGEKQTWQHLESIK